MAAGERAGISGRLSSAPLQDLRRASEIVQVLFKHGFGFLLDRAPPGLPTAPAGELEAGVEDLPVPERVRKVLEALGPTFVKLGQILSTRADIVPEEVAQALKALQDSADPLPFAVIREAVESELGKPLSQLFRTFQEAPLATASIAQVHRATIEREGETIEVVVKVQRPGIHLTMRSDLSLLYWLARALEGTIEEVSAYSPTAIVEQFEAAVEEELDFIHERRNLERAGRCFAGRPDLLVVPRAFPELSTQRVLTMTYLEGVKITEVRGDPRYDKRLLRDRLVEAAFQMVFVDGFFHGDPHPGNVLVLPDGRLGLIDYGLWGRLSKEQQDVLTQWLMAIGLKSPSTLARLTLRVGEVGPGFDRMAYERDIRGLMDKYVGLELSELDSSSIIADSVECVRRHRIKIPPDFAILARATATIEGIVRHLYPELNFQELILPYVQQLMLRRLDISRAGPEAMSLLLGMQDFVNEVPGQLNQLLLDLGGGRFRVGLQGEALEDLAQVGRVLGVRIVQAVLAAGLIVAAAVTLTPFSQELRIGPVPLVPVFLTLAAGWALMVLTLTFVFPKGLRKIRLTSLMFWRRR